MAEKDSRYNATDKGRARNKRRESKNYRAGYRAGYNTALRRAGILGKTKGAA